MEKKASRGTSGIPLTSPPYEGQNGEGGSEEFHDEGPSRGTQCGLGSWRPSWLQPCANVKAFTATLAFWSLFGNMNFTYYTAVITQIERNYGLSSSMSGFIKNVDNIGYMLTVVLFSHFFRYGNKPRIFACATVLSSTAIFIFATPHFFFGGSTPSLPINGTTDNMTRQSLTDFCSSRTDKQSQEVCGGIGALKTFNAGAFGIFILSELLQGVGQSPKFTLSMTYLDDNANNNSPKYFAYMFSMRAFSPVMGFMLGAWTSSLYVDLSDPGFGQRDPRWVGAWWLGFVICACLSIVWAFPMLLFPANMENKKKGAKPKVEEPALTAKELAKDLPRAMLRLIKNKIYMMLTLAICVKIYNVGFMTFFPKYLQLHFGLTASVASILTGAIGASSWAIGPICSGMLVTKLKATTPFKSMRLICIIMVMVLGGYFVLFFLACPPDKWAGDIKGGNMTLECNQNCNCEAARYQPICGDDGLNFYNPCQAGCTGEMRGNDSKTIYTGCTCIPSGQAVSGMCRKDCPMIYPYAAVYFITTFVASMVIVPTMTILMKCVSSKDKATSLAIATSIMQIVAFPAPMLAGVIIDTACLVQQESSCTTRKGACLYYDSDDFRTRMHGMAVVINAVALIFYLLGLLFSRNAEYFVDEDEAVQEPANDAMIDRPNGDTNIVARQTSKPTA